MAAIKRTVTRANGQAPEGEVTPEEAAKIRASAGGREQAPSSRQQALFSEWRKVADALGDPFEVERIPISKLRAMRRDPMLGFGLSFTKTPHIRAKWFINAADQNGPNAQIAAHLDHDLRRIYPSFVLQWMNSLDFGFQAIAKRFEFRKPSGTYIETNPDTGEQEEQPIWSEGNVDPIAWKTFVALPPEAVEPIWAGKGEFNGIDYEPASGNAPGGVGATASGGDSKKFKIDLYHSLWITNERDQNFGSIFGYPRLGYAYRYWWSYWFRWAIADRAFERKADPSVLVYHPDGEFVDQNTGDRMSYAEYALAMGERMRSGGVLALPSDVYEDVNGRGTMRQWQIEFTKDAVNFEPFDNSFDYLDIQKLRSLWIPEQAFLEGKGGTSSRNVAAEMGSSFVESQAVLAAQLVETINRFLIPQWIAVNYPEFAVGGGSATFVMQGFADEDIEFTKEIVQLVGQQESGAKEIQKYVDLRKVLEDAGTPLASFAEQQRRDAQIAAEAAAAAPPAVAPVPGQSVGVVPSAASATGFSYIAPREVIHLSASGTEFIENLPPSPHYDDKAVKGFARQLWGLYGALYADEYASAIQAIKSGSGLEASGEEIPGNVVELADEEHRNLAEVMLSQWKGSPKWGTVLDTSVQIFKSLAHRAAKIELSKSKLDGNVEDSEIEYFLRHHVAETGRKVAQTTRGEVQNFVAAKLSEGITDRNKIAELAQEHFAEFPRWKSDRLVRTEVREIYNAATLMAAQSAGAHSVQAVDGFSENSDPDCQERDGEVFSVQEAQTVDEHPNGTLGWRILPVQLSIERGAELEDGLLATFDEEENKVYFSEQASHEDERKYLRLIGDALCQ